MNILALDIATVTGFCSRTASGEWDLNPKRDESKGMRLIRFKSKLQDTCKADEIKVIVFERVSGFHKNAIIVAAELIGVLKVFCEENKIEYRAYSAAEIKKFGTGNGSANKTKMIEAAQKYKTGVTSDNEADAILLYHLSVKDLNIGEYKFKSVGKFDPIIPLALKETYTRKDSSPW